MGRDSTSWAFDAIFLSSYFIAKDCCFCLRENVFISSGRNVWFFFDECVPHNVTSRWRLYHRTASLLIRSFLNHFFFLRLPNFVKVLKIDEIPVSFFLISFVSTYSIYYTYSILSDWAGCVCACLAQTFFCCELDDDMPVCVCAWWVCSSRSPQIKTDGIMCQ